MGLTRGKKARREQRGPEDKDGFDDAAGWGHESPCSCLEPADRQRRTIHKSGGFLSSALACARLIPYVTEIGDRGVFCRLLEPKAIEAAACLAIAAEAGSKGA